MHVVQPESGDYPQIYKWGGRSPYPLLPAPTPKLT